MIIDSRLLRAAAHFANPDDLEQRPLCKSIWVEQKNGEIHISATDGFMAAHLRIPTDDSAEVSKIGIESKLILDSRLKRRQDLRIKSDGNAVTMITLDGLPFMQRVKTRGTKKVIEHLPLDKFDPAATQTDVIEFVAERIQQNKEDGLKKALDADAPRIVLHHQALQKLSAAMAEIHGKNDKNLGYTLTTTAADRPALIEINHHGDYYGDWEKLTAQFLIAPINAPRDEKNKPPTVGIARLDGEWAVTLKGKHRTRTHSTHTDRADAVTVIRSLLGKHIGMDASETLAPYTRLRTAQRDAALDYYDVHESEERAALIKEKMKELERQQETEAQQLRQIAASKALQAAQEEYDAATAQVADAPETPAQLDPADPGAFADHVAEQLETVHA